MELHISATPKKDYRQNEKAVREWLDAMYPAIVSQAVEEKAEIWWIDETGIRNASNYIKGYAPKGKTPIIPVASAHIGVNMIAAITNTGKLRYHFYRGKFNQNIFMSFLKRIINTTGKKVFAIVDNSSIHRGGLVQNWKEKQTEFIRVFYLPSYTPHLNPVEYLNNNLKFEIARKGYSRTKCEIKKNAMSVMRSLQSTKNRIASFFVNECVKYAKFIE